jgi:hypothetical protein
VAVEMAAAKTVVAGWQLACSSGSSCRRRMLPLRGQQVRFTRGLILANIALSVSFVEKQKCEMHADFTATN